MIYINQVSLGLAFRRMCRCVPRHVVGISAWISGRVDTSECIPVNTIYGLFWCSSQHDHSHDSNQNWAQLGFELCVLPKIRQRMTDFTLRLFHCYGKSHGFCLRQTIYSSGKWIICGWYNSHDIPIEHDNSHDNSQRVYSLYDNFNICFKCKTYETLYFLQQWRKIYPWTRQFAPVWVQGCAACKVGYVNSVSVSISIFYYFYSRISHNIQWYGGFLK